jgi:hypothetical protein
MQKAANDMPDYLSIGADIGALVDEKQAAYGDAFGACGDALKLLYPNGIPVEAYDDALAIVRVFDKLKRLATSGGAADKMGESPWADIAGYAILSLGREVQRTMNYGAKP